jgi:hypothetical protein
MKRLRMFPALMLLGSPLVFAQQQPEGTSDSMTSNRFIRDDRVGLCAPRLAPKANYNIGLGHTFGFWKKTSRR